jgi:hypothetical protein
LTIYIAGESVKLDRRAKLSGKKEDSFLLPTIVI